MYFLSLLTLFSVVFTAKFLHLTDIHLDLIYKASSKVIRQCHSGDGRADIFGEHECDSPLLFVNEVFLHLSKVASEVDFVIISGDLIRHDHDAEFKRTESELLKTHQTIANFITAVFNKIPVYITLGNNDYPDYWTDFELLIPIYGKFIEASAIESTVEMDSFEDLKRLETFRLFGYYTSRISKSLSIISLNTQDFFNPDTKNDDQFLSQLNWLEEVFENLVKLEMKTSIPQKVMILGHVPPSSELYKSGICQLYENIIRKYSNMIMAQFFGHTNFDYFRITYDDSKKEKHSLNKGQTIFKLQHDQYYGNDRIPAAISFISPGIVPLMNPSYRIYQYSNTLLIDFTHYISKQSHTIENHEVSFQPSYSFREAYNVPDLSPISVFNILNRLNHDETLWREYLKRVVSLRSKYYGDWNHKIWSKVLSKICDSEISCPAVP